MRRPYPPPRSRVGAAPPAGISWGGGSPLALLFRRSRVFFGALVVVVAATPAPPRLRRLAWLLRAYDAFRALAAGGGTAPPPPRLAAAAPHVRSSSRVRIGDAAAAAAAAAAARPSTCHPTYGIRVRVLPNRSSTNSDLEAPISVVALLVDADGLRACRAEGCARATLTCLWNYTLEI